MNSQRVVKIGVCAIGVLAIVLGFVSCVIPSELVSLAKDGHDGAGLKNIHVLLPDDVMITMRVSKFFLAHGYPGFNLSDLSQPATSYLWPLILAPAFYLFPDDVALTVAIVLGAASIAGSAFLVVRSRRSLDATLLLIVAALLLNATTVSYLYSGWEYLPEAFMCGLCCYWVLRKKPSYLNAACIGLFGASAVLMRIDAVLLVGPVIVAYAITNKGTSGLLAVLCAMVPIAIYASLQWHWFHNFLPTTARLKANYVVPVSYQARYWLGMLFAGTAVGFIPVMLAHSYRPLIRAPMATKAMIAGVILNYCYAFFVSDVFWGARMYLPPMVICAMVAASLDSGVPPNGTSQFRLALASKVAYALLFMLSAKNIFSLALLHRIETPLKNSASIAAQQLALAGYIRTNLSPADGAIGLFWLGTVSFALPEFEIADFLGKADEQIAQLTPKWGPPGHNKWDIERTLRKWNPAVIVFPVPSSSFAESRARVAARVSYSFFDDAATSAQVRENYHFCIPYDGLSWGLFVRNDLYPKLADSCKVF